MLRFARNDDSPDRGHALKDVDARDKPGHDESECFITIVSTVSVQNAPYSAGLGGGEDGGAEGEAPDIWLVAAFFSTIRTAKIEPS